MKTAIESSPDLSRWSVSRFGVMEYTETPTDRIGRTFVGLVIFPFAFIVGLVVVASLVTGSFYSWLKGS